MEYYQIERLLGLGAVILMAAGIVALLLRLSQRAEPRHEGLVLGYPPHLFPVHGVVQIPALQALAATQARLVAVRRQLPLSHPTIPVGDLAIWLQVFLIELRQIMDSAYRVAVITSAYRGSPRLDRLADDVRQIEAQIVDDISRRLLSSEDEHLGQGVLDRRLVMLRQCAQELATLEDARPSASHTAS